MTIGFSTQFPNGKPTYFVEKIWAGIIGDETNGINISHYEEFHDAHVSLFGSDFGFDEILIQPKIHTMRSDEPNRWKKRNKIHPVIHNRTPKRFQFAPTMPCSGTEKVRITWMVDPEEWFHPEESIDHFGSFVNLFFLNDDDFTIRVATPKEIELIALNDGFDSTEDFFEWFNQDWSGKIIHWTPFRYVPESIVVNDPEVIPGMTESQVTKTIGDAIAKGLNGKVATYGNEWLDDKKTKP